MISGELLNQTQDNPLTEQHFLDYAIEHNFGDLHFKVDPKTGMKAIIAIHNTNLGPALGGCRFIEYPDTNSAIYDAMRLARGMSYKAALVGLPLGGGKSVIIKPRHPFNRAAYFHAFGKFIDELNGRYITALDSGTELSDMDIIYQHTPHVASLSKYNGDPAPYTAKGVLRGIEAAIEFKFHSPELRGRSIAIQGLGHVGMEIARLLSEKGAKLIVADINPANVDKAKREFNASAAPSTEIHKVACDLFSPCALGAVLNDNSINELQTELIAGAANNQLAHSYHGQELHDRGIVFAVDYVINSGGLIFAASKYLTHDDTHVHSKIDGIKSVMLNIFSRSQEENKPTSVIADKRARETIANAGH